MKKLLLLLLLLFGQKLYAVTIKGVVKGFRGDALPFASILIKGTNKGTMTNAKGEYVLNLTPGTYELIFQYLGYKTLSKEIQVTENDIQVNVVMEEQLLNLAEVKVGVGKEDPANTIIRKAIAKSKIHDLQVTSFEAKAYIKTSLTLNSIPFFVKKKLEKEGIKPGIPLISESLLQFNFKQPNTRFTKVIAQKNNNLSKIVSISNSYYLINFYKPTLDGELISPLAPNAFSYYRYEYLGYFEERGLTINKIGVIPINGTTGWRGQIYIIDGYWSIHSVDLQTVMQGITYRVNQIYTPIQKVWMPANQNLEAFGTILGFDFLVKSLVNPTYTTLQTNPAMIEEIQIIDEKVEGKKLTTLPKSVLKENSSEAIISQNKEFSLKELYALRKKMEKEVKQNTADARMVSNDSIVVDSLANQRTSEYWNTIRTVPLTKDESKAYTFSDSLKVVQMEKKDSLQQDSLKKQWKKFVFGHDFKLNNGLKLKYEPPYMPLVGLNYNTVEGIVPNLGLTLHRDYDEKQANLSQFKLGTDIRYGFGNQQLFAKIDASIKKKAHEFRFSGGRFKAQFDSQSGIFDYLNTITTLFGYNIAKIYQKDYLQFGYSYEQDKRFKFSSELEYAQRKQLDNLPDSKLLFNNPKEPFTSNSPLNYELGSTAFPTHNALLWNNSITWKPGLEYSIRNGKKNYFDGNKPTFQLSYRKGMVDVDYDFLSLNVTQKIPTAWAGKLNYSVEIGDFLNANHVYLMDMKHLNSLGITQAGALPDNYFARFRLLETTSPIQISSNGYYKYSTKGEYFKAHVINEFNSLLITQLPVARMYGLKEDLFVNYLNSPIKKNYIELGYGIDGIFRILRLEFISSYEDGKYVRWGWQIGTTF